MMARGLARVYPYKKGINQKSVKGEKGILVCATLFLGDLMMLAPVIAELKAKAKRENCSVGILCRPELVDVAAIYELDQVIPVRKASFGLLREIGRWLHRGGEIYCFYSWQWIPYLRLACPYAEIRSFKDPKKRWDHLVDYLFSMPDEATFASEIPFRLLAFARSIKTNAIPFDRWKPNGKFCVLHVGARVQTKRIPESLLSFIGDSLIERGYSLVITAGPGEYDEDIVNRCSFKAAKNVSVSWHLGSLALAELPDLLVRSSLVIGMDTGVIHLSKSLGVPTVVIMGPSQAGMYGGDGLYSRSRHVSEVVLLCQDKQTYHGQHLGWVANCYRSKCMFDHQKCLDTAVADLECLFGQEDWAKGDWFNFSLEENAFHHHEGGEI